LQHLNKSQQETLVKYGVATKKKGKVGSSAISASAQAVLINTGTKHNRVTQAEIQQQLLDGLPPPATPTSTATSSGSATAAASAESGSVKAFKEELAALERRRPSVKNMTLGTSFKSAPIAPIVTNLPVATKQAASSPAAGGNRRASRATPNALPSSFVAESNLTGYARKVDKVTE